MNLAVNEYVGNNKTRLEYTSTNLRPKNMPSYVISHNKADEFVKKYNDLSKRMLYLTIGTTLLGGITGLGAVIKKNLKMISKICTVIGSTLIGCGAGMLLSYKAKNKLMDKYNVKGSE